MLNHGKSLEALAAELARRKAASIDYLVPQSAMAVEVVDGEVVVDGINGQPLTITPYAHGQIASHLDIPRPYYERMRTERPALLAENVRVWLSAAAAEKRMVRTTDGNIRAFLSPKYRPLDNYPLAEVAIEKLIAIGAEVISSELTETRMYIKAILPSLSDELPAGAKWGTGHTAIAEYAGNRAGKLVAAITISNSEIGAGSLRVEPSVFTTWCTNLAIIAEAAMKRHHVGRAQEAGEDFSIYTDATRQANDVAFFLKVRDVMTAAFDGRTFKAAIESIRTATGRPIAGELPAVAAAVVEELRLPVSTSNGLIDMLAKGGDLTQWGLSSALTAMAGHLDDYESSTDLERAGGKVLALPPARWDKISTARALVVDKR